MEESQAVVGGVTVAGQFVLEGEELLKVKNFFQAIYIRLSTSALCGSWKHNLRPRYFVDLLGSRI